VAGGLGGGRDLGVPVNNGKIERFCSELTGSVVEISADFAVEATPKQYAAIVLNGLEKNASSATTLEKHPNGSASTKMFRIHMPLLFKDTDVVYREVVKSVGPVGEEVLIATASVETDLCPVQKGVKRVSTSSSGYLIKPVPGGSKVTRFVSIDLAASYGVMGELLASRVGALVAKHVLGQIVKEIDFFENNQDLYDKTPTDAEVELLAKVLIATEQIKEMDDEAQATVRKILATRYVAEARAELTTIESAAVTIGFSGARPWSVVLSFVAVLIGVEFDGDFSWMTWLEEKLSVPILSVLPS